MNDIPERLTRIEVEVDMLANSVDRMQKAGMMLGDEVRSIQKSLNQIKYFAMGMAFIYAANTLGLPIALKFIGV